MPDRSPRIKKPSTLYGHETPTDLDRTGIHDPLLLVQTGGDRILGDHGLSRTGMGRDEDALVSLDRVDGDALERIQSEFVGAGGRVVRDVRRDGYVGVVGR